MSDKMKWFLIGVWTQAILSPLMDHFIFKPIMGWLP